MYDRLLKVADPRRNDNPKIHPMLTNVIAFSFRPAHPMSMTDQELDELRLGVGRLAGDWRVDKIGLGDDSTYALLVPGCWGDGSQGAFDVCRYVGALRLTDYRRTEFFGGCEDYQGTLCGVFVSVEAVCDALADLVGTKRTPADQCDVGHASHSVA
jgi:hypothetical protein